MYDFIDLKGAYYEILCQNHFTLFISFLHYIGSFYPKRPSATSYSFEIEAFLGLSSGDLAGLGNGTPTTGSAMKTTFEVAFQTDNFVDNVLSFKFNFLTNEDTPEATFNDFAFYTINPLIELADTYFSFSPSSTFFNEETGFLTGTYPGMEPGITYTLGFGVVNVQDTAVASGLLVDNVTLAMGVSPALIGPTEITIGDFETGNFSGWQTIGLASIVDQSFGSGPPGGNYQAFLNTGPIDPIPEPATMLLLGSGLVGLAGFRKRFRGR